jgi:heme/copper-type cytochrome/quinol oxidase subunit 3
MTSVPHTTAAAAREAARGRRAKPNGWWAMAMLVATEGTLFAVLIAVYFYLRFKALHWPPPEETEPKVAVPLILMGVLVTTSLPMQAAATAAVRGRLRAARLGLLAAALVGSGYLAMQMHRFLESLQAFRPSDNAYASITTVLVGGHHAHVLIGLLLNLWLLLRLSRGLTRYRRVGVQAASFYWHFVNVLALAVTGTTLSPAV